jgi:hypothetical protein
MSEGVKKELKQWAQGCSIFFLACLICGFVLGVTAKDANDFQAMEDHAKKQISKRAMTSYGNLPLTRNYSRIEQEGANGISQ